MAEVFGAVASGAGLVSLGLQIFEGTVKLRDLCSKIHGAPKEIFKLLTELDVLVKILEEYDSKTCAKWQDSSIGSIALGDAMHSCTEIEGRSSRYRFSARFTDPEVRLQTNCSFGTIKFALIDKRIDSLLRRIERAKSSLSLATNTEQSIVQRERFHDIKGLLRDNSEQHSSPHALLQQIIVDNQAIQLF